MNSALSWSIKGIEPEAREAAKIAARKSGMTLGQWLNSRIISTADAADERDPHHAPTPQHHAQSHHYTQPRPQHHAQAQAPRDWRAPDAFDDRVDYLEERLAALTRVQSDTALNATYAVARPTARDDQAMQFVLEKLNRTETDTLRSFDSLHNRLDQLTEVVSQTHANAEKKQRAPKPSGDPRYETLEQALDSVVSHIEQSDTSIRDTIDELRSQLNDLGETRHQGADQATRGILGEIEQQLTALAHRVDRIGEKGPANLVNGIDSRLSKLAQRVESTEKNTKATVGELRGEIEQQIRDLESRLQAAMGNDDVAKNAISDLREEVSGLGADIDLIKHHAASEHDLQTLRDMLGGLTESIETQLGASNNDAAFDALERRISEVSERLSASLHNPAVDQNMEVLERKVHEIDARLAATQDDDPREQIMFAVEQQVSGLAQRLNGAEQRYSGIQAIEKSIAQLFEAVEQTRTWSGEAAQLAASQMADKLQAQVAQQLEALTPGETASPDAIKTIEAGLAAVKASAASADQRTQETLEAVHDTLEKVVTRLIALENQARQAPAAQTAPPPAATLEAGAQTMGTAPNIEHGDASLSNKSDWRAAIDAKSAQEMEEILASAPPGDAAPMQLSMPAAAPAADPEYRPAYPTMPQPDAGPAFNSDPGLATPGEPQDQAVNRRNDFIAAARRAAQAASQEPQAEAGRSRFSVLRRNKKQATDAAGADGPETEATSGGKRRPLILAAIVLLLIGAVSAYSLLGSKRSTDVSELTAPPVSETLATAPGEPQMLELPGLDVPASGGGRSEIPLLEQPDARGNRETLPPGPGTPNTGNAVEMLPLDAGGSSATTIAQTPQARMPADAITTGSINPASVGGNNETRVSMDPLLGGGQLESFSLALPADQIVERNQPATASRTPSADLPPAAIGTVALRTAAAQGDPAAQFIIASRFTDGEGVAQDYRQAALWYQRAAAQGLAPAQYRLGTFYEKGRGVPQDLAAARIWYERAAENGNRKAMHNLAVIYADGRRGDPNFAKAALWFRNAAELGLRDSQYNLAILHERGLGVELNLHDAYRWFALAAHQGDEDAQARLGVIEAQLSAQDLVDAKAEVETWQPQLAIQEANVVLPASQAWVSSAAAEMPSSTLPAGTTRELVLEAQTLLNTLGYDAGSPDGIIGERTRTAIRTFEGANGLTVSGSVSATLIDVLRLQAGA